VSQYLYSEAYLHLYLIALNQTNDWALYYIIFDFSLSVNNSKVNAFNYINQAI